MEHTMFVQELWFLCIAFVFNAIYLCNTLIYISYWLFWSYGLYTNQKYTSTKSNK